MSDTNSSEISLYSSSDDSNKKLEFVRQYYSNNNNNTNVKKLIENCEEKHKNESEKYPKNTQENIHNSNFICDICNDKSNTDNYMILSCNHIFHIRCLAESHLKDIYKYNIIDEEYFENRKCNTCLNILQLEEVTYLHGKFLSNTKTHIETHQISIEKLEFQLKQIKDELRTCYDYKHKLEHEREKSKQIISILNTIN